MGAGRQAYGGTESDYRPERWKGFREDYRFTGKEEDVEVGLQYFGKRYYAPLLNRWVSADPLAVHVPGEADLNLYAYVSGMALKATDPVGLEGQYGESGPGNTPTDEHPAIEDVGGKQARPAGLADAVVAGACSTGVGTAICAAISMPGDTPIPASEVSEGNKQLGEAAVAGVALRGAAPIVRAGIGQVARVTSKVAPKVMQVAKSLGQQLDEMYESIARGLGEDTRGAVTLRLGAKPVQAGEAGGFADLHGRRVIGDKLTPHHMPQAAAGYTTRSEGGALVLPQGEHGATRTYLSKGRDVARAEKGLPFREVLVRDIRDIRSKFGTKYDEGLRNLLKYYKDNFPELMKKK